MLYGITPELFDQSVRAKGKPEKDQQFKPNAIEEDQYKESFKKVFSKMLDKKIDGLENDEILASAEISKAPHANKNRKLFEHIQISDHPGRFAMMKALRPEKYEDGFDIFKQITASEFDPDKLPKSTVSELGFQNLVNDIGLGVIG
jgi:hypothetical protein